MNDWAGERDRLHRVATHILARRRFDVSGRFGLRAGPGGIATPSFGSGPETVRLTGTALVVERAGDAAYQPVDGSTLRDLARLVDVDLDREFSAGDDTPALGDVDEPIRIDAAAVSSFADWFQLGAVVLDSVVGALPPAAAPVTIQLWPEHFDMATNVAVPSGGRVNLGFSPGDSYEPEPYMYVGPWGTERPGDGAFWNAPFGAVLRSAEVLSTPAPAATARAFLEAGLRQASA